MTRMELLERVLVTAEAVLERREDHMLTSAEWDALIVAVREARADRPAVPAPAVRIVIEDDLMLVMDDENQGYDCLDLEDCSPEYADSQIDRWAREYQLDVEAAKRELAEYFRDLPPL